MKILISLILGLLFLKSYGQCGSSGFVQLYGSIPRFITLYQNQGCIEKDITDTTICVSVRPRAFGQLAYYSYSSPSGEPVFVEISQYNSSCQFIASGNEIFPSTDTTVVCYTIRSGLIDNFCPYVYRYLVLSAAWCGVSASHSAGNIYLQFSTCSNANTDRFNILVSSDGINWSKIFSVGPKYTTSSSKTDYSVSIPYFRQGVNYLKVVEVDWDGNYTESEACSFTCMPRPGVITIDLSGRQHNNSGYLWGIK